MSGSTWLIDKSAMVRLGTSPDVEQWANRIQRGLVHICTVTLLEVGYSARTAHDLVRGRRTPPLSAMPLEYSTPAIEDRALDVQRQLAERGQHRAPSILDLLIAATAEINNRVVLHLDKDFDLIAAITGQPLERLVI
ncbi:PIN domain nuclease [Rhodococcus sp. T7]|uniref:PIN domain nuclease n=1 Tax=Rhodococcus sp. T7 TaxID=627444 RepID=UPI00135C76D7|nr:PIN domain nuclease [Rhodococcus sp. T7]KAF0963789.1 Ribonuclease VapC2 [Rhodococcus sp. T7]